MELDITSQTLPSLQDLLKTSTLRPNSSILDAFGALDRSNFQLALVMDSEARLVGLVADGDVRRALLQGYQLNDSIEPIYTRNFIRVDPSAGRAEVIELMQSHQIRHVPTIDESGRLLGIHFWTQMLTRKTRPNAACILAGGLGRRLYPLTKDVPKPMLKVAGRPILERIILHLIGHGIHTFYLSINYLGEVIKEHFSDGMRLGCKIIYLEESCPLGTGGPLGLIGDELKAPLLVMNGDLITQINVGQLLDAHTDSGFDLTVATRLYQHKIPFGCLQLRDGLVERLEEKPVMVKHINAGIYVLQPRLLKMIPKDTDFPITRLIESLIDQGAPVGTFELSDDWIDIGQKDELDRARGGATGYP